MIRVAIGSFDRAVISLQFRVHVSNLQEWFQEVRTCLATLKSSSRHKLRADSLSFHATKKGQMNKYFSVIKENCIIQGCKNSLSFERRRVLLSHYFDQTRQTKIWSVIQNQKTKI